MSSHYSRFSIPTDDDLAGRWCRKYPLTVYAFDSFRRYESGCWPKISKMVVKGEVMAVLVQAKRAGIRPSRNLLNSVLEIIKIKTAVETERWDANPDILVLSNGTLEISSKTFRKHSPEDYVTSSLPFPYDPSAKAPGLERVLSRLPQGVAEFIQEYMGYSIIPDTSYELLLWLYGPPGCGKSTVILATETVAGSRCINLGLANLERSRFALANIAGKTVATATEQLSGNMTVTYLLNAMVSGEKITIEQKYKNPYDIVSSLKIIWGMNERPSLHHGGNGFFRRVKVVEFPALPAGDRDPTLKDQIRNEGSGILNLALDGLHRLRARGRFLIPPSVVDDTAEYQLQNDIPAIFLQECCLLDPSQEERASKLYEEYDRWCRENGHKPLSSTAVAENWKRLGLTKRKGHNCNYWIGVQFKPVLRHGY